MHAVKVQACGLPCSAKTDVPITAGANSRIRKGDMGRVEDHRCSWEEEAQRCRAVTCSVTGKAQQCLKLTVS